MVTTPASSVVTLVALDTLVVTLVELGFLDGSASSVGLFGGVTGSVSLLGGAASSVGFLDDEGVVVSLKGQGDGNKLSSAIPCGGGAKGRYTWIYPLPSDGHDGYRSICFTSDIFLIF